MCGINGVFWYAGGQADRELVRAQARAQRHRGPDDADVWCEGPVALGHRRLAQDPHTTPCSHYWEQARIRGRDLRGRRQRFNALRL